MLIAVGSTNPVKLIIDNVGWYKYISSSTGYSVNNGEAAPDPIVRVYDHNNPPTNEDGLKYLNYDSAAPEKTFYPTCNNFVEVIDANGNGMPWVERLVENPTATETPAFFPNIGTTFNGTGPDSWSYNLADKLFGLGKSTLYGASVLNGVDLLGRAAVQFFTNNTPSDSDENTPYAGRPYGCWDSGKGSCKYLGYCESSPATTCLTIGGNGATSTCVANGNCISYGYGSESTNSINANQKNTFKNIFLKSISGFWFNNGSYQSESKVSYDAGDKGNLGDGYNIKKCSSTERPLAAPTFGANDADFCAIWPRIENVYLYRGNGTGPALTPVQGKPGEWLIGPGYYTLKFNSFIDAQQQPMKQMKIDWGDGKVDLISNQDNHPSVPHVISHNYNYSAGTGAVSRKIKIEVTDNWGFYKTFPVED